MQIKLNNKGIAKRKLNFRVKLIQFKEKIKKLVKCKETILLNKILEIENLKKGEMIINHYVRDKKLYKPLVK